MINIKNILSRFKGNAKNKITNIKNSAEKFKENFSEARSKTRSKRKSLFLGFSKLYTYKESWHTKLTFKYYEIE